MARTIPERPCEGCGALISGRNARRFCGKKCVAKRNSEIAATRASVSGNTKQCRDCGKQKEFSEFSAQKLGIGGVRARCKPCEVTLAAKMRRENPMAAEAARRGSKRWSASPRGKAAREAWNRKDREEKPEYYMWRRAQQRAEKKGMEFTISPSDVVIPRICPILGIEMRVAKGYYGNPRGGGAENSLSLDRINNDYGYIPGNVAVVSWLANRLKGDATIEQLELILGWMKSQKAQRDQSQQAA